MWNIRLSTIILRTALVKKRDLLSKNFKSFTPLIVSNRHNSKMAHNHYYTNDTPVLPLDAEKAFNGLKDNEKLYAHHLSKASWFGSLAVLFQTSPESPLIFIILRKLFNAESLDSLKYRAISPSVGLSENQWKAFVVYSAAFYCNMGNYRGFGDSKFIPNLPKESFHKLVQNSAAFEKWPEELNFCLEHCLERMYSVHDKTSLGFAPEGMTTYFSANMTKQDGEIVKKFFEANRMDAYNTRVYKDKGGYVIRFASVLDNFADDGQDYMDKVQTKVIKDSSGKEYPFRLERGDHSTILQWVNDNLLKAKEAALNANEANMIKEYILHFKTGDLDHHKAGSRHWIKDKGPIVESYIGFIENYRDPAGQRAEFEGFVAIVNQEMSKKFEALVHGAPKLLKKLPWGESFEKDNFLKPDFTSLDVLTFSGSGIPAGINIPNYDEIRQSEGFKNVSLGNVIQASFREPCPNFLSEEDAKLVGKYSASSFEVQVGLHELLGHGSGKLFKEDENGKLNFDKAKTLNWKTKAPIDQWYKPGESYDSKFGAVSSAFEECRAEAVGLYLSLDNDVLKIFGFNDPEEQANIIYVNWLCMIQKGIEGLKMYDPANKRWLQAHSQARFLIARFLIEKTVDFAKIFTIDAVKNGETVEDLRISLTRDQATIRTKGGAAIQELLQNLQLWKSTGDSATAIKFFNHYSDIETADWNVGHFRQIVLAREKPRRMMVEASTSIDDQNKVILKVHPATHEGIIESFQNHFNDGPPEFDDQLIALWKRDLGKMF